MSKIAVVTDTNSGITREEAKKLGVYLLPMPFIVDGTEYFEGVTCTYEHFFEMLEAGAEVSTSQPSPESLTAMWEEALATPADVVFFETPSNPMQDIIDVRAVADLAHRALLVAARRLRFPEADQPDQGVEGGRPDAGSDRLDPGSR